MNKTWLTERVAEEAGTTKAEAQKHFGASAGAVTEALEGGEEVRITGFGKLETRERAVRGEGNPRTKEKMTIPAKQVPSFGAGNALKESIR